MGGIFKVVGAGLAIGVVASLLASPAAAGPVNAAAQPAASTSPPPAAGTVSFGGGGLEPLVPARVLDTRTGTGAPLGRVGPGGVVELTVAGRGGVPAIGVGAVVLNVTAVAATAWSYVTVWPTGAPQPDASNLNIQAGDTIPNLVTVKVGAGGKVSLFNFAGEVDLLADVVGWFPEGTGLEPLVPARVLDTRTGNGAPAAKIGPDATIDLTVTGHGSVPTTGVGAVVLNVTAVDASAWSYITAWPTGQARPDASNLNVQAGDTIPNLVIVKVGDAGRVSLYNFAGNVDLLADVVGWFPEGTGLEPLVPAHVLDTRTGNGAPAAKIGPDATIDLTVTGHGGVPTTGVGAVVLNVTAVDASAWSYITAWPTGQARPDASNLNVQAGDTIPNLVIVKVGDAGRVSLYNFAGNVDLLADVVGWFPDGSDTTTTMSPAVGTVLAGSGDVLSAEGMTVVLAASADIPAAGGHLVVLPQRNVPAGVSGRVTSIAANGDGTTTVTLAAADLQDMFAALVVHGPVAPAPSSATSGSLSATSAECEAGGGQPVAPPKLTVGGYTGHADFDLWGGTAEVELGANAALTWALQATATASCEIETPKALVAVVGPITFELGATVTASVSATVSGTFTTSAPITIGFRYDHGDVENLSGVLMAGSANGTDTSGTIDATVFAAATLDVKVASVGGIVASVGPRATLTVEYGCAKLVGELVLTLAAEVGRWGVDWDFDLADIVFASRELYSQGCGTMAWTGDLHTTMHSNQYFDGGPEESFSNINDETSTITLLPKHPANRLAPDGSGDYAALLSASLLWQNFGCIGNPSAHATDVHWSIDQATRQPLSLNWDVDAQQWRYDAFPVEADVYDPWYGQGGGFGIGFCSESETWPVEHGQWIGWGPYDIRIQPDGLLNDLDPDPYRLVGTTTWTVTNPNTEPGTLITTSWTYTLTYDLRLVDTDTI